MSKQYNIRWRRSDYAKLSHLIKKVNAKAFEISVKRPDIAGYQPVTSETLLDYQEVKANIHTRRDLKLFMNRYRRYLQNGAEEVIKSNKGGYYTKWHKRERAITDRIENREKKKLREEILETEVKFAGKGTGYKRGEMGSLRDNELKERHKNLDKMSQKEMQISFMQMDRVIFDSYKNARNEMLRDNYITALHLYNYPPDIEAMVRELPIKEFIIAHYTDEACHIDYLYAPEDFDVKVRAVRAGWQNALNEWKKKEQKLKEEEEKKKAESRHKEK